MTTPAFLARESSPFPFQIFECPRKTLCAHLIIGWCEHPPSTFIGEFECQAQNPIRIPIQHYPLTNQHTINQILKDFWRYGIGGVTSLAFFWRGPVTPSRFRFPSAKPFSRTYIIFLLNNAPCNQIKCFQDMVWGGVTTSTFSGGESSLIKISITIRTTPLRLYGLLARTCYHKSYFYDSPQKLPGRRCGHHTLEGIIWGCILETRV